MASEMGSLPAFLYHGTDCKNVESICENGLYMGSYETCNPYTKETGVGTSFVEDCIGNVSLAVDEKDAIFFIVANAKTQEEFLRPQCIIKVRTSLLNENKLMFRELFGKPLKEAKYWSDIDPGAIEEVKVRTFETSKKGKLKAIERIEHCKVRQ
jgi:hypothetical protein